jgi:hypothetical protein
VAAEQLEGGVLVHAVAFHQDALGPLGHGAPPERPFEVLELGEAAQDDVECVLELLGFAVDDVGEYAALAGFVDEGGVGVFEDRDRDGRDVRAQRGVASRRTARKA